MLNRIKRNECARYSKRVVLGEESNNKEIIFVVSIFSCQFVSTRIIYLLEYIIVIKVEGLESCSRFTFFAEKWRKLPEENFFCKDFIKHRFFISYSLTCLLRFELAMAFTLTPNTEKMR